MAEGWARHLFGDGLEVFSAGLEKHGVNPFAVQVMQEAGVDISGQRSQRIDELPETEFDLVITLCGHAAENCPFLPGAHKTIHRGFDDPPRLAAASAPDQALDCYRLVRDQIRAFITDELPLLLEQ